MTIKNIKALLFAFTVSCGLATAITSCSDDLGNSPVYTGRSSGPATKLQVLKDSVAVGDALTFGMGATSTILGIDCDGDWTAEVSDTTWVKLSNHAGYGYFDRWTFLRVDVLKNAGGERSTSLTLRSGSVSKTLSINQRGTGTDPGDTFPSSYETLEQFVLGYNIGNTLDSNPTSADGNGWWEQRWAGSVPATSDWETAWGQPVTTPEIIETITNRGFNVIRIPVTWFMHMDASHQVDPVWMARVKEVVDMVLATGSYAILNVQHDTGAAATAWLIASMDVYPTASVRYKALWTQIANTFRDYGDHLLFECFNEILYVNNNNGWTPPSAGSDSYEAIRRYHQDFVDAVRATGGNNEYRNLVINPYAATNAQTPLDEMAVPTDKHANHLLMSVHSYDPYNFCNNNAGKNPDGTVYDYNILTFNEECRQTIDGVFQRTMKCASDLGIPVFFGEFGAIDGEKDPGERIKYATYVARKFKQYGTTGLWWMGLLNRETLVWEESQIVDALFDGIK